MVDKLDDVLMETRVNFKECTAGGQVESSLSSTSSTPVIAKQNQKLVVPQRKIPNRFPFHQFGGPKCLRFAEAVNGGGAQCRRKKPGTGSLPIEKRTIGKEKLGGVVITTPASVHLLEEDSRSLGAIQLEVVLPSVGSRSQHSGLRLMMGEEDLNDVDEFVVRRRSPEAKRREAVELLQIQCDLGTSVDQRKQNLMSRMIDHEDRDREKFEGCEEMAGFQ
jgi:hypothetical protein